MVFGLPPQRHVYERVEVLSGFRLRLVFTLLAARFAEKRLPFLIGIEHFFPSLRCLFPNTDFLCSPLLD